MLIIKLQAAWCMWRYLVNRGLARNVPMGEVLLWCWAMCTFMYLFKVSPGSIKGLPKSGIEFIMGLKSETSTTDHHQQQQQESAGPRKRTVHDIRWAYGCAMRTLKTSIRAFVAGYGLRAVAALVGWMRSPKLTLKHLIGIVVGRDHLRLGAFFGGTSLIFWAVKHAIEYMRGFDDAIGWAVAGEMALMGH